MEYAGGEYWHMRERSDQQRDIYRTLIDEVIIGLCAKAGSTPASSTKTAAS